jgi:hypothetical protein
MSSSVAVSTGSVVRLSPRSIAGRWIAGVAGLRGMDVDQPMIRRPGSDGARSTLMSARRCGGRVTAGVDDAMVIGHLQGDPVLAGQ